MNEQTKQLILIISPSIIFLVFWICSLFSWFDKLNKIIIRRLYYLLSLIWVIVFFKLFYEKINIINIVKESSFNQHILSIVCFSIIFLIMVLLWDVLFISCKSFKAFSFKDLKVTTEEVEKIAETVNINDEEIKALYFVLKAQTQIIEGMKSYIQNQQLHTETMYNDLIAKYSNLRKDIKVYCFIENDEGMHNLQKKLKLSDLEMASILYSIKFKEVCIPTDKDKNKDIIYARIKAKAVNYNLIVAMVGETLIQDEHIIIQNIVSNFELQLELEYINLQIEDSNLV